MSVAQINVQTPSFETIFYANSLGAAAVSVKSFAAEIYALTANNSLNANPSYIRLFNLAASSVVNGVTDPDCIILVPGFSVVTNLFATNIAFPGLLFGNALSVSCAREAGTAGTTPPIFSVSV